MDFSDRYLIRSKYYQRKTRQKFSFSHNCFFPIPLNKNVKSSFQIFEARFIITLTTDESKFFFVLRMCIRITIAKK